MGSVESIPVASQLKSFSQWAGGRSDLAKQTQEEFSKKCIVISQLRSLYHATIEKDEEKAKEVQIEYLKGCKSAANGLLNGIPIIGHIKGGIHYLCNDIEEGDNAMKSASRTVGVISASAAGFITLNVPGAVMGAMVGGQAMDAIITAADSKAHGEYRPNSALMQIFDPKKSNQDKDYGGMAFDTVFTVAMDGLTGYTTAKVIERMDIAQKTTDTTSDTNINRNANRNTNTNKNANRNTNTNKNANRNTNTNKNTNTSKNINTNKNANANKNTNINTNSNTNSNTQVNNKVTFFEKSGPHKNLGEKTTKIKIKGKTYYKKEFTKYSPQTKAEIALQLDNYEQAYNLGIGPEIYERTYNSVIIRKGIPLDDAIKQGIISKAEALNGLKEIESTLRRSSYAHCDIKLENVMYFDHEGIKLIDTGSLTKYGSSRVVATKGNITTARLFDMNMGTVSKTTDVRGWNSIKQKITSNSQITQATQETQSTQGIQSTQITQTIQTITK